MAMKRPTIEEVQAYAVSIGWPNFDSQYFLAKMDSIGWVVPLGKTFVPVASWQGVVMIWKKCAEKRGELKPKDGKSFKERYEESQG
jgi:hypothetical protein